VGVERYFPYESFRPGQLALAERVHESCAGGKLLLTEAMSGFGKTAAVLSGALLAAEETGCRVVYACRTKRQIFRVVEELVRIQKKTSLSAASISSKFDYCLLRKRSQASVPQSSFGWYCGYNVSNNLCSYFLNLSLLGGRLESAVAQVSNSVPAHSDLMRLGESLHVCPYELVRTAMTGAAISVVPYHYVFDPVASQTLVDRAGIDYPRTILVVDEAHNIRDFLRETWSCELGVQTLESAITESEELLLDGTTEALKLLMAEVRAALEGAPGWYVDRDAFVSRLGGIRGRVWLQNLAFELKACSSVAWASVAFGRKMPRLILGVGDFLGRLLASPGNSILTKWDDTLRLVRASPTDDLPSLLSRFHSSVLVSATMNPSDLFLKSLGIERLRPETYSTESAPAVRVRTVIDTGVTTRFKSRTPEMYARIASKIAAVASSSKGGTGVFAPSYTVLDPVFDALGEALQGRRVFRESRGLPNQDASDMMDEFRANRGSVLFAVQGGRFSEGEDFREDSMDSVVVLGLSLPPPTPQLYAEYLYIKRSGGSDSYLMLSLLPALRKAFQAAGRHIRTPGKRGMVFLMDRRFDSVTVRELMPSWLREDLVRGDFGPEKLASEVLGFLS
jgi:DNA excision repair protein ERCC-2